MESVKRGLAHFCKGFGIWFVLLLLNTRSGEGSANGIKIVLDIILAVVLVGNYRMGKEIAMLIAALTTLITFLQLPIGVEIILLIGIVVLGGVLLKMAPDDNLPDYGNGYEHYETVENVELVWKSRNAFNPFEKYSYTPDGGIGVRKGILRRSYSTIPTTTTRAKINQTAWQHILGLCEVSFQNNYTGQKFGEDSLRNIRFKSAMELMRMLSE